MQFQKEIDWCGKKIYLATYLYWLYFYH
jgi:hypothetical protein